MQPLRLEGLFFPDVSPHRLRSRRISVAIVLITLYCTTCCCLNHSSLTRIPNSPRYSSRLTRYRTRRWWPFRHPAHRRHTRHVSLAIVLITSNYIPSVSVTLRAALTTTPSSPAYSSRYTRYRTRRERSLRHPPHRRRTYHVSLAIQLVTSYCTTSCCLCSCANNDIKPTCILIAFYLLSHSPPANCSPSSISISNSFRLTHYPTHQGQLNHHPPHRCCSHRV
jgi:hypothetical protein